MSSLVIQCHVNIVKIKADSALFGTFRTLLINYEYTVQMQQQQTDD